MNVASVTVGASYPPCRYPQRLSVGIPQPTPASIIAVWVAGGPHFFEVGQSLFHSQLFLIEKSGESSTTHASCACGATSQLCWCW
jgi:hypothetical protein